jgi:hypothetical protein
MQKHGTKDSGTPKKKIAVIATIYGLGNFVFVREILLQRTRSFDDRPWSPVV